MLLELVMIKMTMKLVMTKMMVLLVTILGVVEAQHVNWTYSGRTQGMAQSCQPGGSEEWTHGCDCNYPLVACRSKDLEDLSTLDLPSAARRLDLSRNSLTALDDLSFTGATQLRELFLSRNQITFITGGAFHPSPALEVLDLSRNLLTALDEDVLVDMERLTSLDLSHNLLKQLVPLPTDLIRLSVAHNPLGAYLDSMEDDSPVGSLSRLNYLDLSNISITKLHIPLLVNNTELVELRISRNLLEYIPTTAFFKARFSLEFLDMTDNPITVIPNHGFHGLHALKRLIINNMPRLESIEALAFHDLHSLEIIEIQNNIKLTYIHPKAFRDNLHQGTPHDVSAVYLQNNMLTSLDYQLLPWFQIQDLQLEGNPWYCDCQVDWLAQLALNRSWSPLLACAGPKVLAGKALAELKDAALVCETSFNWSLTVVLGVIMVMCLPTILVASYMLAQQRWPSKLPKLQVFGKTVRDAKYQMLDKKGAGISVIDAGEGQVQLHWDERDLG